MSNRIETSVEMVRSQQEGMYATDAGRRNMRRLDRGANANREDHPCLVEVADVSLKKGLLSADEHASMRAYLGPKADAFNGQPCHVKTAVRLMLQKLFDAMVAERDRKRGDR